MVWNDYVDDVDLLAARLRDVDVLVLIHERTESQRSRYRRTLVEQPSIQAEVHMPKRQQNLESSPNPQLTSPEAVVRRLIDEGFSLGRLEIVDELIADDLAEHQDYGPNHAAGPEGVKAVIASLRRAFSDFRLTIEDVSVAGDLVWTRNVATGTNDGPFMGFAPTGRSIRINVFDVLRVVAGKVVEHWGVPDRLGALVQIGAVRPPARQDPRTDREQIIDLAQ